MPADPKPPVDPMELLAGMVKPADPPPPPAKPRRRKLKDTVQAPPPRPSLEAFLDHFFLEAGGPVAVAKMMYAEFLRAAPGSQIRARVLETVLRSLKSADDKARPMDDLGIVTDEDLDRIMEDRERHLLGLPYERPGNPGPPQGAAAPPAAGHAPDPPAGPAPA